MDLAEYGLVEHDLAFLKEKLDNSELITVHGNRSTTGEITSYTPATGYTFYHIKSMITAVGDMGGGNMTVGTITVSVRNDSTIKDVLGGSGQDNTNSSFDNDPTPTFTRNYSDIPDKLIGNSSKKYSLNCDTIDGGTVYGTIIGYIEAS